ncbi:serine carboxypeptidase [Phaffia rhodozyma]|uniref:Carboxypeptidase n=1 Tax=Phaffia rhodozyma TaxID=264483 RepID=A0A0F7SHC7_PHARH|nr:serine carboxypeptidase [Phaffia rhodozyma]
MKLLLSLLPLLTLVSAEQLRFATSANQPIHSFSTFDRVLNHQSNARLADLKGQADEFVTLEHRDFPSHSVRIKETTGWCDPDVSSFTGYLDVGNQKNLFFYFFESRHKPETDPLVMWINGGPGCSSSMGMFMELGPCSVVDQGHGNLTTKPNPHSWNNKANVFFLDEPIGVGFSYAEHGQIVGRAEQAAIDVQAFISIFIETFKEFQDRPLHLSGESYGGRYLPVFAAAIYDGNKALIKVGSKPINLKSILIGNGLTDTYSMVRGYYQHSCTNLSGVGPILNVFQCQAMAAAIPRCEKMLKDECLDRADPLGCGNAMSFCAEVVSGPFFSAERNPYDISKSCTIDELSEFLCYPETQKIAKYLDQPWVRQKIGANPDLGKFQSCSPAVGSAFHAAGDITGKTWYYVASLLEHDIDVLIYVGKLDWICNFLGNAIWTNNLEWSGQEAYAAQETRDWHIDDQVAGQVKSLSSEDGRGGLTYMTINGAGHMVPTDKPKEASQMFNNWLEKKSM